MIRRDNSQDGDKGRYYSTFWIEVAMGKANVPGASAAPAGEDTDLADVVEFEEMPEIADVVAPPPPAKPVKKASEKKQEPPRSLTSLADLANIDMLMKNSADLGDEAEVDLASDEPEDLDVPLTTDYSFEESAEDEEFAAESGDGFEEEEDFDEEEEGWSGGRKPKPSKPLKPRREPRRPY